MPTIWFCIWKGLCNAYFENEITHLVVSSPNSLFLGLHTLSPRSPVIFGSISEISLWDGNIAGLSVFLIMKQHFIQQPKFTRNQQLECCAWPRNFDVIQGIIWSAVLMQLPTWIALHWHVSIFEAVVSILNLRNVSSIVI